MLTPFLSFFKILFYIAHAVVLFFKKQTNFVNKNSLIEQFKGRYSKFAYFFNMNSFASLHAINLLFKYFMGFAS